MKKKKNRNENCAFLVCYVASSDNTLLTFRDNLLVPLLRVCSYRYSLHNSPEECSSHLFHGRNLKSQTGMRFVMTFKINKY